MQKSLGINLFYEDQNLICNTYFVHGLLNKAKDRPCFVIESLLLYNVNHD